MDIKDCDSLSFKSTIKYILNNKIEFSYTDSIVFIEDEYIKIIARIENENQNFELLIFYKYMINFGISKKDNKLIILFKKKDDNECNNENEYDIHLLEIIPKTKNKLQLYYNNIKSYNEFIKNQEIDEGDDEDNYLYTSEDFKD